jgi:hypothetical protein
MSLNKFYKVWDMGYVKDKFETFDGLHYFKYTGTVPTWFTKEPFIVGSVNNYPTFSFLPPITTSGTFTFGVEKYLASTATLVDSGVVTIDVQEQTQAVWNTDGCYTANLVWLDPSGGWESYLFVGNQQAFQDKGTSSMFVNSDGEKRFHRKDEVHQGTIISTGNVSSAHADFIADAFKSIQVYLWGAGNDFTPIIINPETFKKVKTGDSYARYDFEFRYAVEDVIQTQ